MLTTVAGADPMRVFLLMEEPLWRVLYVYHHLDDRETREALSARVCRVETSIMAGLAVNNPTALADEMQRAQEAIADYERGPVKRETELEALRARGEALADRIAQGRILSPEALVS